MLRKHRDGLPKLSVIIPHLNEPGELPDAWTRWIRHGADGVPFEVIVVDNGSTELPETVCHRAGVRLESEPIPGPGPARNCGANVARAALLAFIDADCVADPNWVRTIVEFMDRNRTVDVVGGDIGILAVDPAQLTSVEAYESNLSYRVRLYVERYGFAATGNMAVRAEVFRAMVPSGASRRWRTQSGTARLVARLPFRLSGDGKGAHDLLAYYSPNFAAGGTGMLRMNFAVSAHPRRYSFMGCQKRGCGCFSSG